jgi:hypothetical protein
VGLNNQGLFNNQAFKPQEHGKKIYKVQLVAALPRIYFQRNAK